MELRFILKYKFHSLFQIWNTDFCCDKFFISVFVSLLITASGFENVHIIHLILKLVNIRPPGLQLFLLK